MFEFNLALFAIGGLTLLLSLIAGLMHNRVYVLSEPILAVLLGVLVGPVGFDLIQLADFGDAFVIIEQFARLTVGLAVMAAALRLPPRYFRDHFRPMGTVLVPGMVGMWLVSALLVYAVLGLPPWIALLIGAIVTPTDPVLAGTIVTGNTAEAGIAGPIRNLLSGESGANDGLAYPLVFLPILVLGAPPREALVTWLFETLLWQVGGAVIVGAAVGAAAGLIEVKSKEHEFLEEVSLLSVTVALTFAVLGGVKLLGSDGILAAFVAGMAFNRFADATDRAEEQRVQETVLRLFTFPVFFVFGVALPWEQWLAIGWIGIVLVVGVLLLRRVPMVVVFVGLVPDVENVKDALFAGWFGPIGIAALFYAMVSHRLVGRGAIWPVVSLVILSSILVHGVTATPFTKRYGK